MTDRYDFMKIVEDIFNECKTKEEIETRMQSMVNDIENFKTMRLRIIGEKDSINKNNDLICIKKVMTNQTGLYEKSTGKWIKWLSKKDINKYVNIDGIEYKEV